MEPEFLESTKFLPNLPKSNLDDRTFEELVEECLLRIPRYCPEWTNYNPGDPGVTLIELFSWLVDQMLYRFNQVPRRHYVALLELLGIRLDPPKPASTELTFYLTKSQSEPKRIEAGTEVATVRTENQEAVIFTTDKDLIIGQPYIKHVLRAPNTFETPRRNSATIDDLAERIIQVPQQFEDANEKKSRWNTPNIRFSLFDPCEPNHCFYMVFESIGNNGKNETIQSQVDAYQTKTQTLKDTITGNVLAITFRGPEAVTTGINTENPPLKWQAWNGKEWQDGILRRRQDDRTKGFSFDKLGQESPNPVSEGVDVILHLPQNWPADTFDDRNQDDPYYGHWIRCIYEIDQELGQYGYERSPEIIGIKVRSIGGTISASECIRINEEFLGTSNGKPGQVFDLDGSPILLRTKEEHIRIISPEGNVENWKEVADLADSNEYTPHYLLDSQSGRIQFGPLIREPSHISTKTRERSRLQSWGRGGDQRLSQQQANSFNASSSQDSELPAVLMAEDRTLERQYGQVPPLGSEIYMTSYRVGGGTQGNVQAQQLKVMKTSIPYVKRVINYKAAIGGLDAESLDNAVMRVPALLRTRETALTPEDFEHLAKRLKLARPIHRAHAVTAQHLTTPGIVRLLLIPTLSDSNLDLRHGIHPNELLLDKDLQKELHDKINLHKTLGIGVALESPQFVGIQVTAQILLESQYHDEELESTSIIKQKLVGELYNFLNPITGGFTRRKNTPNNVLQSTGWTLGRAVKTADVIALLQNIPEVSYVSQVKLTSFRQYGEEKRWISLSDHEDVVILNELEVACSWDEEHFRAKQTQTESFDDPNIKTAHQIQFMNY